MRKNDRRAIYDMKYFYVIKISGPAKGHFLLLVGYEVGRIKELLNSVIIESNWMI